MSPWLAVSGQVLILVLIGDHFRRRSSAKKPIQKIDRDTFIQAMTFAVVLVLLLLTDMFLFAKQAP